METTMPETVTIKTINIRRLVVFAIIAILLTGNILWLIKYSAIKKEAVAAEQKAQTQQINEKVLNFTDLFITKVLQSQGEVSFNDRLQLENSVRDLNSQELLNQWNKFVNAQDPAVAQREVKNLLQMLISDIKVK